MVSYVSPDHVDEWHMLGQALSAILDALSRDWRLDKVMAEVNWATTGTSPDAVREWWRLHKEYEKRAAEEKEYYAMLREKRADVLARLSPEDREVLGY
jgi:hypothetical protein